ncbi:transporter [Pandoraea nosoerga]|uniref:Transporter n=1 Tax=Pandoraea nosoerga TaxID=2508296 RepID=A0A5E4WCU5_9BURK|nr:transporter [Pandoraea nosoerga]MBN4665943.1 transporter [Pandoraea nosoerga]MBN4676117.1 transporter [Pandoraea nosoerga]MBN4682474.1 transporter [Pandoraea nosoerga]MBN4745015.1 transporter [Pandoraea nosoerga]VVE22398.1 transporter [Pandoraea nosoerga]
MKRMLLLVAATLMPLAAHATNPLVTDDTGTQDTGNWQLELNSEWITLPSARQQQWTNTLTYGVLPNLDVAIQAPYQRMRPDGDGWTSGFTDLQLQAKWRFLEGETWSLGLKPFVSLPTASEDRGLGNGRATTGANLLMQYNLDRWTFLANVGYTWNNNSIGNRQSLWNASTAALFSVTDAVRLVADVGLATNPDTATQTKPAYALVGAIYSPTKDLDFDVGYKRGLNPASLNHSVQAGVTLRW